MSNTSETFESLWSYCASNRRVIPKDWHKLYEMLPDRRQNPNGGWTPPLPLILAAWHHTSPLAKHLRFREHIEWARDHAALEEIGHYLRSLTESEWYHYGEL